MSFNTLKVHWKILLNGINGFLFWCHFVAAAEVDGWDCEALKVVFNSA